ncbi:MAG TPA: Flp family type IVb pilin [Clostridiales bacterium]|nr:Flp family type IVb pilin [Clostridiales bacterium]HQA05147.1 Flp family type IVb pilin [Clostridiales bacterium]
MLMNWLRDEEGQAMVEYGLIIALIAIAVIGALAILGPKIAKLFDDAASEVASATSYPAGAD